MLAYLLWHRPADGIEQDAYEQASERFHRSLHHAPPVGFCGSALYRVGDLPWLDLESGGQADAGAGYEDWYLLEDFAALGVLNEAAVGQGHRSAHDGIAHRFGAGAGGLYALLEGHLDLSCTPVLTWVSRPPGATKRALGDLLGDGMDPEHASLWRRALVFGPAPEYCLLAQESPAGVASSRLPQGWRATITTREEIWNG